MLYDWSNKKLLIVEDTHVNYLLFKIFLETTKIHISYARNSEDFFRLINNKYDLVLMDVNLGEKLTGIDLIKYMRKIGNNTPVIIQTAYIREYVIDDDIKHDGFIEKPIKFPVLFEKINNIFNKNGK